MSDDSCKRTDQNERRILLSARFRRKSTDEVRHRHHVLVGDRCSLDDCFLLCNDLWLWTKLQLSMEAVTLHWEMPYEHALRRSDDFRSNYGYICLAFADADSITSFQSIISCLIR